MVLGCFALNCSHLIYPKPMNSSFLKILHGIVNSQCSVPHFRLSSFLVDDLGGDPREQGRRGACHWGWSGLVDEQVSGSGALSARVPQRAMLKVSDVSPGLAPSLFWFLGIFNP